MKKSTSTLMNELNSSSQIDKYLKENSNFIIEKKLFKYLQEKLDEKGLSKSDVIKKSEINEIYGYQILSGKRFPSRNKLLCICIGAEFSVEETNEVLRVAEFSPLYPKLKRDSVIIFCIKNRYPIWRINEELFDHDLQILS